MVNLIGVIGDGKGEYSLVKLIQDVKKEPESEPVHVIISSPGGDADMGFNMYDYLRGLGRQIITECKTECASAASIVFLAGDRRIADCPIMIHNPWASIDGDSEQLQEASKWMADFEKRCEKFYSEKTGVPEKTVSDLMKNETYLSPSEAVAFGFATEARPTAMALMKSIQKPNNQKEMTKEENEKNLSERIVAFLSAYKGKAKMQDVKTATGDVLTVERDSGDPQVGDKASPDGTFVMPDGSTIVVAGGVITGITPAPSANQELERLKADNAKLQKELDEVKSQLTTSQANAKTDDEAAQLNAIKAAGGFNFIEQLCSKYVPQARAATPTKPGVETKVDAIHEKLEAAKRRKEEMFKNG